MDATFIADHATPGDCIDQFRDELAEVTRAVIPISSLLRLERRSLE